MNRYFVQVSGLDKHQLKDGTPLKYSHIDIAASAGYSFISIAAAAGYSFVSIAASTGYSFISLAAAAGFFYNIATSNFFLM